MCDLRDQREMACVTGMWMVPLGCQSGGKKKNEVRGQVPCRSSERGSQWKRLMLTLLNFLTGTETSTP